MIIMYFLDFQMRSTMNWLSKLLESMANAFIHPVKNDLPPSIGAHAYSGIPLKRKCEEESASI